ncbi:Transmembrane and ubiquitin-like domain-containing protein 1 [Papilio machaon]|uniref:Transmembrane and ubiquitin-like domain-containing protein 1 n=1 Tax=Papilio machaon TaxID=76193 RepID=A0A194R6P3_PAPMA|nr:Transmembrane and ubiquitin-like domain-containing protein 1 [Papilio machaon]
MKLNHLFAKLAIRIGALYTMTLIEGVGDEVVQFVISVLLIIVGILAWWSTNARPNRYRPVMMMRTRTNQPIIGAINLRSTSSARSSLVESRRGFSRVIPLLEMDSIIDADMAVLDNNRLHFYRSIETTSNNAQRPIETQEQETETQEESEPGSNAQIAEMDSIISAMEAEGTADIDFCNQCGGSNSTNTAEKNESDNSSSSSNTNVSLPQDENITAVNDAAENVTATDTSEIVTAENETSENATAVNEGSENATADNIIAERDRRKILIKLKFLNDTLKEVEGNLDELLKDFKWRHFSAELSAECRVRLIFNGRVLLEETATLEACGLHHRAVVHCLVHPKRNTQRKKTPVRMRAKGVHFVATCSGEEGSGAVPELGARPAQAQAHAQAERAWDMENILMTIVSIALTVVWFFRCEYSNMFTASASVALFGLTVFYSVAIFGLYLSDTFHVDRRNSDAPLPPN